MHTNLARVRDGYGKEQARQSDKARNCKTLEIGKESREIRQY